MNLCACDSDRRERGVGAGVKAAMLSETLQVIGFAEAYGRSCPKGGSVVKKNPELVCM